MNLIQIFSMCIYTKKDRFKGGLLVGVVQSSKPPYFANFQRFTFNVMVCALYGAKLVWKNDIYKYILQLDMWLI